MVGVVHIRKVARKRTRIGLYLAERAELGVPVPWGKIETEFQPVAAACVGKLSDNIAFAVFIRAVFYAVVGVFARPKTESVVMFCCDNSSLHAGGFECFAPLVTVELCRIEYSRGVCAVTPLCTRVSVWTEMHECIKRSFGYKSDCCCQYEFCSPFTFRESISCRIF